MNPSSDLEFPKLQSMTTKSSAFTALPKELISQYLDIGDSEEPVREFQNLNFNEATITKDQSSSNPFFPKQYYDPFLDTSSTFQTNFPRAADYSTLKGIVEGFPHLEKVNDSNFNVEEVTSNAKFFIMRSSNDDNIHKAIKYHIWTTTPNGKAALREAWQSFEENKLDPEIYLVFTVVSSNQFLGVAKMTSNINDDESFRYWWEPCKWFGSFQIKWLFVKDIHHSKFEHMRQENSQIINLRDTTPINANIGKQILTIFKNFPNRPNIFEVFAYMDKREDFMRNQRDNDEDFKKYFMECCETYQKDPNHVFQYKRPNYGQRRNYKKPNHYNNYDNQGQNNYNNYNTFSNGNNNNSNGYNNQYNTHLSNSNVNFGNNNSNYYQNPFGGGSYNLGLGGGGNRKPYNQFGYSQRPQGQRREDYEPPQPFIEQFTIKSDLDKSNKKNKVKKTKKDYNDPQEDKRFIGTLNFQSLTVDQGLKEATS